MSLLLCVGTVRWRSKDFFMGFFGFEIMVKIIWKSFNGISMSYKQWFLRFLDGCLDLEIKLLFVGVKWVPKLTLACIFFKLDISVETEWSIKSKLEKYNMMVILWYECLLGFSCIIRTVSNKFKHAISFWCRSMIVWAYLKCMRRVVC